MTSDTKLAMDYLPESGVKAKADDDLYRHLADLIKALEDSGNGDHQLRSDNRRLVNRIGNETTSPTRRPDRELCSSGGDECRRLSESIVEPGSDDTDTKPFSATQTKKPPTSRRDRRDLSISTTIISSLIDIPPELFRSPPPFDRHSLHIESDSYPDTPSARRGHRRKRLIKRSSMNYSTTAQFLHLDIDSMDLDNVTAAGTSGGPRSRRRLTRLTTRDDENPAVEASCSTSKMDYDAAEDASSISGTDSECSDNGREGDDEQSDWVSSESPVTTSRWSTTTATSNNLDQYMGIPAVMRAPFLLANASSTTSSANASDANTMIESSDTDISQSSSTNTAINVGSCSTGRRPSFSNRIATALRFPPPQSITANGGGISSIGATNNRRLTRFLRDANQVELSMGPIRKSEKLELMRLAGLYKLEMRMQWRRKRQCLVFRKTRATRFP